MIYNAKSYFTPTPNPSQKWQCRRIHHLLCICGTSNQMNVMEFRWNVSSKINDSFPNTRL